MWFCLSRPHNKGAGAQRARQSCAQGCAGETLSYLGTAVEISCKLPSDHVQVLTLKRDGMG